METKLRACLIAWLRSDPMLSAALNSVTEEVPLAASPPWLGIAASASADWSTKDRAGREIRMALELHTRGGEPGGDGPLIRAIEHRMEALPKMQDGFEIVTIRFVRARAERRANNLRSALFEYRFRVLESA